MSGGRPGQLGQGSYRALAALQAMSQLLGLLGHAHRESFYVLRYEAGQRYEAHTDHCSQKRGAPDTEACR